MLFYDEFMGEGTPVVFLPGAGWPGREGLNIAESLKDQYRVSMVDLPGYGRSQGITPPVHLKRLAEWLKTYLVDRQISQAHLIGHSLGGSIALALVSYYPEYARSLTLLDVGHRRLPRLKSIPGPMGYVIPLVSLAEHLWGIERVARILKLDNSPETRPIAERIASSRLKTGYGLKEDRYLEEALAFEPQLSASGPSLLLALYRAHLPEHLSKVQIPTLLVYATQPQRDVKTQQQIDDAVKRVSANSALTLISVAGGHYVHWVEESVITRIVEYIKSVDENLSFVESSRR